MYSNELFATKFFACELLIPLEMFFKINIACFRRKTPVLESLFNKVAVLNLELYQKRDTGTGIFLWIFRNFQEYLFYKTPLDDCFCCSTVFWTFSISQLTYNRSSHQIILCSMRVSEKYWKNEQYFTINT